VRILVLNPGSTTLKATVLDPPRRDPRFETTTRWVDPGDDGIAQTVNDVATAMRDAGIDPAMIDGVGYRVVHGGEEFTGPVVVDDGVIAAIDALADVAPLHNGVAAATIRGGRSVFDGVPHVVAFDTAFHATLPEAARRYPVPDEWVTAPAARRFGFHGLSVAWSTTRAAELLDRPVGALAVVVAHLGGGCSVTAVDGGRSVDTSMGMTPLEGLMMATRAGSIDPGLLIRRVRDGASADEIEHDLDHRSGLLGVGGTGDMVKLLALRADGDHRAALAIEIFVRRAAAGIAGAATCLPRLDAIVFTGGIGEHAAPVRADICGRLGVLGVALGHETAAAARDAEDAILASGPPAILRVHAREDLVIARAFVDVRQGLTRASGGL
jgi:acetate kinase